MKSTTILVVLALTNLVAYAARNALFAVYPDLQAQFHIDHADIGLLTTLFMVPHALATLGFGWAGDRYDRRNVIVVGIAIASAAGAAGALATTYTGLAVSRMAVGLGTAAVVPVANSILGQIFDGPAKARRISVFNLGLFFGGVVGFGVGQVLGFPLVVVTIAVPGVALIVALRALPVPAHPRTTLSKRPGTITERASQFVADARRLLAIRTLRWVMASATAMAFAAGGYTAWLKEFLTADKGMSEDAATRLLGLALVGGLAGIVAGARVADRLRHRHAAGRLWTIAFAMAATLPCAIACVVLPASPALYVMGVATMFFISWYHAPIAASVDDLAPPSLVVAAQGLVIFTMHMVGTAPSSWVIGVVSKQTTLYTAMWVPTVALAVAALCMLPATTSFARDAGEARSASL